MSTPRYDAIVIGAGMSGLAAGIRLAQFDKRVVIVERHSLWGGLNSFYKRGGRRFDTGLHALTNYVPKGTPGAPLTKILRQLRIPYDELRLVPQTWSQTVAPGVRLRFANQFGLLESEVGEAFPNQRDRFGRLVRAVAGHDPFAENGIERSARAVVRSFLDDELLIDLLLVPILYYGSAREDDVDWDQFVILFRSLFVEGFARPEGGVKRLLDLLVSRFKAVGGELRMRAGVSRIVVEHDDAGAKARGVVLDDGSELAADEVLSSAGFVETMRLSERAVAASDIGRLSFFESISVLDTPLASLGLDATITFFHAGDGFRYRRPERPIDVDSGVICATDNYRGESPATEGLLRVTALANYDRWNALEGEAYTRAKEHATQALLDSASRFSPEVRAHTTYRDAFTPRTIRHYTGHIDGTVYGSPTKRRSGETDVSGLHLIGTDQGFLGVVGALLSGISMANRHALIAS
jgi:phytoene dehydrogenase-like protein